jgi:hypothetical protein
MGSAERGRRSFPVGIIAAAEESGQLAHLCRREHFSYELARNERRVLGVYLIAVGIFRDLSNPLHSGCHPGMV